MAFEQHCRRRGSSNPAASSSLDAMLADASTTATEPHARSSSRSSLEGKLVDIDAASVSMSPQEPRSARSTSSASRNSNRLSLTLPIAPPNSLPSRPIPTPSSVPPTPYMEAPAVAKPADPNEFIVAIAAQERRVLELREDLAAAELDLKRLKKQFTASQAYKKRSTRNHEALRGAASAAQSQGARDESPASKRNSELERRKAILRAQSQGASREYRRTVIRGGHTRTLSLLSPAKPMAEFPSLESHEARRSIDSSPQPDWKPRSAATISKRATWAPRQAPPPPVGVKQIANDFKQGLWTFVEDLRQATVGDEAISGKYNTRTPDVASRLNRANGSGDLDTIRASNAAAAYRGRIPFPTETVSETNTPITSNFSSSGSFNERLQQKELQKELQKQQQNQSAAANAAEPAAPAAAVTKARKHFSWTPLTFDQFDDDDWSNWDTPTTKQSRWSGSTVNGDIIPAPVSEKLDESEATLRRKRSLSELRSASQSPTPSATGNGNNTKLEELPQAILNRLSPGNIKKTAADFMREWEKSLSPPPETATVTADSFFGDDMAAPHAAATTSAQ